MKVRKLAVLGLYTALAMIIFVIELMLPTLAPFPGMKLGLANIVTLILLCFYTAKETFCVLLTRIVLTSLLTGQMTSFCYSLSGGICCFLVMYLLIKRMKIQLLVLVSMAGAVAHNLGQILMAYVIVGSGGVFLYLPVLMLSGLAAGFFTGLAANTAAIQLRKLKWTGVF